MARANGEPHAPPSSIVDRRNGRSPQETHGQNPPVRELLFAMHDVGSARLQQDYIPKFHEWPVFYHHVDYEKPENHGRVRGWGHVLNVVTVADLHLAALGYHRNARAEKIDPLELDKRAATFFENLKSRLMTGDRLPKGYPDIPRSFLFQAVAIWEKMNEKERRRCVNAGFLHAAEAHDQGNFIQAVHDWKALRRNPAAIADPKVVEYHQRQMYDGAEKAEAEMFIGLVDEFHKEMGLSPQQARVVGVLGADMIWRTVYLPNFVRDDENFDREQLALPEIDQAAAMLNPKAPRQIIGLVNEIRVRIEKYHDKLFSEDFAPGEFCGGFIPGRFAVIDRKRGNPEGTAIREYLGFLDEFRQNDPREFARILEAPVESVKQIGNLYDFVMGRMKMQQTAADIFWPEGVRNQNGRVAFVDAFKGWTAQHFQRMERICRIYQENFWNPAYTVEQFQRQIDSIAPDRR